MKNTTTIVRVTCTYLLSVLAALSASAAEQPAGPKGGRLLAAEPYRAEFFVNADRKVEISFYDEQLKPVPPKDQVVAVTAEAPSGREKLELVRTAEGFVSSNPLPAGDPYRVVVQVRPSPETRPSNFRIDLALHTCGECDLAEYACTCHE